ncbi:DUF2839 domain-containing protein [Crocosphaera chwakensis]|uniref:DUF2839 domain-containing protein n=1 Tax=Crocosphaera chwakensis CCY0110 TaxID=391612 RepID=A3IVB8_9CHRO|nr:DUF2839 domain-containing protein [Crocosphaera chwakensis]EAZ89587.1 hypothetical protein CY0110_08471 [Crocosphaera chwakensis CCY0110]
MGEAKRRKEALGEQYGQEERILPWLPISKRQGQAFYQWTTRGAWVGIGIMVAIWLTVRVVGPGLGWWNVQ